MNKILRFVDLGFVKTCDEKIKKYLFLHVAMIKIGWFITCRAKNKSRQNLHYVLLPNEVLKVQNCEMEGN